MSTEWTERRTAKNAGQDIVGEASGETLSPRTRGPRAVGGSPAGLRDRMFAAARTSPGFSDTVGLLMMPPGQLNQDKQLDIWENLRWRAGAGIVQPGVPHGGRAGTHSHRTQALGPH